MHKLQTSGLVASHRYKHFCQLSHQNRHHLRKLPAASKPHTLVSSPTRQNWQAGDSKHTWSPWNPLVLDM